jgi:hypothetical protein
LYQNCTKQNGLEIEEAGSVPLELNEEDRKEIDAIEMSLKETYLEVNVEKGECTKQKV